MNPPTQTAAIVLVPGERFFLKEVPLEPGADIASQVELALEASSPFPLAQLYHGHVASPDRRTAVAYAAYRRRFSDGEMADWPAAAAVFPEFLGLFGPAPSQPLIVAHVHAGGVNAVAWDGRAGLPVAAMSRTVVDPTEPVLAEVIADLRRRAGLDEIEVRRLEGPVGAGVDDDGNVVFRVGGEETARLAAGAMAHADVRDRSFLQEKRRSENKQRGWSRALAAAAALLILALGLEIVAGGLALANQRRRDRVAEQAEEVKRIETAQTLATRIEDLAARQERPLEWLALVSAARPRSVQFTRVVSSNDRSLVIDAQTADAAAVGAFEEALRGRPELEEVATRDLRSREGLTSFVLFVRFGAGGTGAKGVQP